MICHLSSSLVEAIHGGLLRYYGGRPGVRNRGLLEAAVSVPRQSHGGKPLHTDLPEMAAAYLFHICRASAFEDANERVGLYAALLFLRLNDRDLEFDADEIYELTVGVMNGSLGKADVTRFFREGGADSFATAHRKANLEFLQGQTPETAERGLETLLELRSRMTPQKSDFLAAFDQTARFFKKVGQEYVVIGGIASSIHGEPRMTKSIEVLVPSSDAAMRKLVVALSENGFELDVRRATRNLKKHGVVHAVTCGTPVDLISGRDWLAKETLRRAPKTKVLGKKVRLATVEDCILMKAREWGLADVPVAIDLVERHRETLDRDYLLSGVKKLRQDGQREVAKRVDALFDKRLPLPPAIR